MKLFTLFPGTGTPRGDPTELNALGTFFSSVRSKTTDPLLVGSVKSNIGHTESAAGTAGLLKVILMMHKGLYVPSLHLKSNNSNLNPNIRLSEFGLQIPSSVLEWPCKANGQRHACLNSFGFGGSNTHVIISQIKPSNLELKNNKTCDSLIPICISGVDKDSLKLNLSQFHHDLTDCTAPLTSMAQTSFHYRDIYPYRTLVYGKNSGEVQSQCEIKLQQIDKMSLEKKHNKVFVYCGVGTTWTGMCRVLIETNDAFRRAIIQIDTYLEPLTGWKIGEKFDSDTSYDDPFLNHIAIFCCQVALTEVWKSFGIIPDIVIGQSVGEVAAAHAANLLTLEEAVKVIYYRSKVLSNHSEGSMAVIGNINIKEVENLCSRYKNEACIAVYSSPTACTVSGQTLVLKCLTRRLQEQFYEKKLFLRKLNVRCGYHSSVLDSCLEEIKRKVETSFTKNASNGKNIPMISTSTGKLIVNDEVKTGTYWAKNVRDPVLFMQCIKQAYDRQKCNFFLEVGPRPVLKAHLENILGQDSRARAIPSMLVGNELQCFYRSLTELFESGVDIDYFKSDSFSGNNITCIPRYNFNKTGSLYLPTCVKEYLSGSFKVKANSHMFVEVMKSSGENIFAISIDEKSTPFVYDHYLSDEIVVPGALYVETGFHIGKELWGKSVEKLTVAFDFVKAYKVSKGRYHKLSILLKSQRDDQIIFHVMGHGNLLAVGTVSNRTSRHRGSFNIKRLKTHCTVYKSRTECYNSMKKFNFQYGESLRLIQRAWISNSRSKCLTEIYIPNNLLNNLSQTHFHPAVIDSVFQIFGILANDPENDYKFSIPKGVNEVVYNTSIEQHMFCYVEEVNRNGNSSFYNAVLLAENGTVIAEMDNYFTATLQTNSKEDNKSYNYVLNWSEAVDILDEEFSIPRNILLYTNNKDADLTCYLAKTLNIGTATDLQSVIKELNSASGNISLIVHVSTITGKLKETDGTLMLDCAVKRFIEMKKLLEFTETMRNKLSITFITENTQQCPGRDTIHVGGSEIWGMIRSAAHEGLNKDIKLVDIDRQKCDVKVLTKLISCTRTSDREFAMTGSKLFRAVIQSDKINENLKRPMVVTSYDKCGIYSGKAMEVSEPYLMLSHDVTSKVNTEPVILESFSLHENVVQLPTAEIGNNSEFLLRNDNDCQIIIVEGRGKLQNTGKSVSFIYPTNAMTVLNIPQEHLIDEVDCPVYLSGILILANVLSQIASSIEKGTDVVVIKQSEEADIGQDIFNELLNKRTCKTWFSTFPGLKNDYVYHNVKCLVVVTTLTIEEWETLLVLFPVLTTVVSLKNFVQEELHMWLQYKFTSLDLVFLSIIEMQSVKNIRNALPHIKDCLLRIDCNELYRKRSYFLFNLPIKELHVHQKINDGSLRCFSNKGDIFRPNACYIIVGGLTGLGWELVHLMAEQGAGVLVPLSRRRPGNEHQQKIEELQHKYSCQILPMQADVSHYDSLKQVFTDIHVLFPTYPIRGIFHGAGITIDSALENLDKKKVLDVMKPKILGAWNLHLASLNIPLDFFVIHSSIVSVIGNPGQCNYAAANSYLDSFAYYRRSKGLAAQSINWGALSVGMAVENRGIEAKLKRNGFNLLEGKRIREAFLKAIVNDSTNVVYADIEWDKVLSIPTFSIQSFKYSKIRNSGIVSRHEGILDTDNFGNLHKLDRDRKTEAVKNAVTEITLKVLVIEEGAITDQTSFTDLGMDSMTAMSLSNALDELFHYRISVVSLLSEETTIGIVVETVVKNIENTHMYKPDRKQEAIAAIDDPEAHNLFTSENITFMQKDLLAHYLEKRNDPYYLRIIDVEVRKTKFHKNDWKLILTHVLKLRPELRRKYHFAENGDVSIEEVSESDLNVNITDIPIETLENTDVSDVRKSYDPDISGFLPFNFQVAESESNTLLRIVTHALVTDMKGMSLLCKDIQSTAIAYSHGQDLPSKYPPIDICSATKRAILPKLNKMGLFWDNYMNVNISPLTLGTNLQDVDASFCSISCVNLPCKFVARMKKYVAKQGISLYEFIMSLYQLYLHVGSKSFVFAVGTAADMRFHVPELNNVLTRCANYIPVIAHINNSSTIAEFIQRNSEQISAATDNGAYPSSLILKKVRFEEARKHLFRHFLVMNDMTEINKQTKEERFIGAEIKRICHVRPDRETFIYVSYDLKKAWMKFEVGINEKICGNYGKLLTDKILWLADEAMVSGNKTIQELRNQNVNLDTGTEIDSGSKHVTLKNCFKSQLPCTIDLAEKPCQNPSEQTVSNLGGK